MLDQQVGSLTRGFITLFVTIECVLVPVVQPTAELSETDEELSETDEEMEETNEEMSSAETKDEPVKSVGATVINNHMPASMAYWIQSTDPRFYRPPQMFVGPSCVERCLDVLQRDVDYILWILRWGNTLF